jgi:PhnB protein
MATLNVYLYFQGDCEQAFRFYKDVFGGEFEFMGRYKDVPQQARANYAYCTDEQIMHVSLPISKETILMGADLINPNHQSSESMNSFSLYITAETRKEAERIFNALSAEGDIIVAIDDQFWGSYYGQCFDKFGINWKISCSKK